MSTRLRIATDGFRGNTSNRRISIATFGLRPFGAVVETTWRNIKYFMLSIKQIYAITLGR